MADPPIPTPSANPQGEPPAGDTGSTAPCCPDVATFEAAPQRESYFGFDDTTNDVANVGVDEYWNPPTKAKSVPADRETRDGARWVSVGLRQETEVEINFAGSYSPSCLMNCTFEFDPPSLGEVVTPRITRSGIAFKIKGREIGEGSLKVMCDGQVRGYFHVWCAEIAEITVDVACLISPTSQSVPYVTADLEAYLNEVYRQALIRITVKDYGELHINPSFSGPIERGAGKDARLRELDELALAERWPFRIADYRLYYYQLPTNASDLSGSTIGVGNKGPGFAFQFFDLRNSYWLMAHELGHLLNLSHPMHDFDKDEYPPHQFDSLIVLGLTRDDPLNVMGYFGTIGYPEGEKATLRYRQWKKCYRG